MTLACIGNGRGIPCYIGRGSGSRGTNGSQLWDISFITQAMVESGLAEEEENREALLKALGWLDRCQIRENPKHYESAYRQSTKGAWPFSTKIAPALAYRIHQVNRFRVSLLALQMETQALDQRTRAQPRTRGSAKRSTLLIAVNIGTAWHPTTFPTELSLPSM